MSRPARFLGYLWVLTSVTFLLSAQGAWPLYPWLSHDSKLPSAAAGALTGLLVLLFPENIVCLSAAFLCSAAAMAAWHSWLGAYQPLLPAGFLFLAWTRAAPPGERRRLLLDSFLLAEAAGVLHALNRAYLSGFEFTPPGTLHRDFPGWFRPEAWFSAGPALCAILWLAGWALSLPGIARNRRAGWLLFAATGAVTVILYKVVFYAVFLFAAAAVLFDPGFLGRWRAKIPVVPPLALFLLGETAFFAWYLFYRENTIVFAAVVALVAGTLAAARFEPAPLPPLLFPRSTRSRVWLAGWSVYLLLPFVLDSPAPFGMTQFTAREALIPPTHATANPLGLGDCGALRHVLALRWGYRIVPGGNGCTLYSFH